MIGEADPSGNLTSTGTFDVYGAKRQGGTGAATSRQGFVGALGHVSDSETGLVYMRARYYDPNVGRFISQDPKQSGSNWFVYCSDNPTNLTDFTGKDGIDWVGAILGAIGIKLLDKYVDYLINDAPEAKCALGEMLMNIGNTMMGAGESLFEEGSMTMTVAGIMDASNQFGDLEVAGQMAKGTMQGIGGIAEFAAGLTLQSVGEFIYYM